MFYIVHCLAELNLNLNDCFKFCADCRAAKIVSDGKDNRIAFRDFLNVMDADGLMDVTPVSGNKCCESV